MRSRVPTVIHSADWASDAGGVEEGVGCFLGTILTHSWGQVKEDWPGREETRQGYLWGVRGPWMGLTRENALDFSQVKVCVLAVLGEVTQVSILRS